MWPPLKGLPATRASRQRGPPGNEGLRQRGLPGNEGLPATSQLEAPEVWKAGQSLEISRTPKKTRILVIVSKAIDPKLRILGYPPQVLANEASRQQGTPGEGFPATRASRQGGAPGNEGPRQRGPPGNEGPGNEGLLGNEGLRNESFPTRASPVRVLLAKVWGRDLDNSGKPCKNSPSETS